MLLFCPYPVGNLNFLIATSFSLYVPFQTSALAPDPIYFSIFMSSSVILKWSDDFLNSCIRISSAISVVFVRAELLDIRGLICLLLCYYYIRSWFCFFNYSSSCYNFCFSNISCYRLWLFIAYCWRNRAFSALKCLIYSSSIVFYFCMNS